MSNVRIPPEVAKRGTYQGWREAVDAALSVTECPHWTLGAAAGFVGPVIGLCDFDTCGINFSGPTSRGKTTAVALGVSPWTSPLITSGGLLRSMRTTENSIELAARQANHTILGLDELGHVDGKLVARAIYFLSGGISKARMSAKLTAQPQYRWHTFVLLSSEMSLAQKVIGDGGKWTGGMAVRFVDVDCTDVDAKVPKDTMAKIAGIHQHYGVANFVFGTAFLDAELETDASAAQLRAKVLDAADKIAGEDADGARRRAAMPFALIGICGTLAREFGVLPKTADIDGAVTWGWEKFTRSVEALTLNPEGLAMTNLKRWVAQHWDVAIKKTEVPYLSSRDAFGWYDDNAIYIPIARISEAVDGAMSVPAFARLLIRGGLLWTRTDNRRASIRRVPAVGKVDVYALKKGAFRE
jgi:hypothetical protein